MSYKAIALGFAESWRSKLVVAVESSNRAGMAAVATQMTSARNMLQSAKSTVEIERVLSMLESWSSTLTGVAMGRRHVSDGAMVLMELETVLQDLRSSK